jgi:two-component system, NtrC family, response regulator AtoC
MIQPRLSGTLADSRVLIAGRDREITDPLRSLLATHRPLLHDVEDASLLTEIRTRPTVSLVILCDPGADFAALDLLQQIKESRSEIAVLLMSPHPTVEHATEAIRRGADDFIAVPYAGELVLKAVDRILEAADLRDRVDALNRLVVTRYGFERIVSRSAHMHAVMDRADAAARSDTPVLILGETGTGKELIARAIHANSRRAKRPFIPINCAALPRDLVESELFGHRRGAFSGAFAEHAGLFVAAHGGTLFLDEIGELPLEVQAKLLRVLQDGEVRPVGGLDSRRVDVRIIAASNQTLISMRDSKMRQDLFFRLSVLVIEIPPLRRRREDLPLLAGHFIAALRDRGAPALQGIEPAALDLLGQYPFPGNIRELENLLEGISVTLPPNAHQIREEDVRAWLRRRGELAANVTSDASQVPLRLASLEAWAIGEALRHAHGNKSLAAQILGISRDTLYRKLHELNLSPETSDDRT